MILFEQDWDKYPTAIIDTSTKNKSFVNLALLYRDMGIKNNAFHLSLINPDLRYIDPHSDSLSLEEIALIAAECKLNPWYYFREVVRAPAEGALVAPPLKANRGNIGLYWLFFNNATVYLIQPRQTGKSFSTDCLMTWLLNFRCVNTTLSLITKDLKLRADNITRIKNIFEELPRYMDQRVKKDKNNSEQVTIINRNNFYKTFVAQQSPKAAEKILRGHTCPVIHIDEGPYISNIEITTPSALAALNQAIEIAKVNKSPYGIINTTTAGKKDDRDGQYVYKQVMESMIFDERLLYDCVDRENVEKSVRKHSRADKSKYPNGKYQVNCTFSHRQLGYSDDWLAGVMERNHVDGEIANRDYFNVWTAGNEKSPLSVKQAETLSRCKEESPGTSYIKGYEIRWYIPVDDVEDYLNERSCVLGLDTSEAIGGDDIALVITDVKSLKVIGAGNYNQTNLHSFSVFLLELLKSYDRLIMNIESKSTGVGILNYLLIKLPSIGINPFTRLFNRVVQEKDDSPINSDRYIEAMNRGTKEEIVNKYKKFFGYPTSGTGEYSRSTLYGNLFTQALHHSITNIRDEILTRQLLSLVVKNGRIDHDLYEHDDMVIAWLLSHYLIQLGKGLDNYGIESSEIMSDLNKKKIITTNDYISYREDLYQQKLRKEINDLVNQLRDTKDHYRSLKIEKKLRYLESQLVLKEEEVFSIEQLIKQARKDKLNKSPRTRIDMKSFVQIGV